MPIKLQICATDPQEIPMIEVEIPDACPECGADFSEPASVIEEQFVYGTQPFGFTGQEVEWEGTDCQWEGEMPIGHRCAKCNHKLTGHGQPKRAVRLYSTETHEELLATDLNITKEEYDQLCKRRPGTDARTSSGILVHIY